MNARRILIASLVLIALIAGGGYFYIQKQRPLLELGVGYGARVACGCVYMGNRPLEDCYKDFEPGMEPIRLSEDPKTKTVTASVPLIASRSATYDPVLGCQPTPYTK